MADLQLYGEPPGSRLISYHVNRLGVHEARVRTPYVEKEEAFTIATGPIPSIKGLIIVDFYLVEGKHGGWEIEWAMEGNPAAGTGGTIAESATYGTPNYPKHEFVPTMIERSLLAHPRWLELKNKYGGYVEGGRAMFPEYLPDSAGTAGGSALNTGSSKSGQANPMHGVSTYRDIGGVFTRSYTARTAPRGIFNDVQKVVAAPLGLEQIGMQTPNGRNWLVLAPSVTERGNVYEVVEQAELSGPGGHNQDIYYGGGDR